MVKDIRNIGASVRAQLLRISKDGGQSYQLVLTRYANERLLYRLAEPAHAERFVLKGAVLLMRWFDEPFRGTRDVDPFYAAIWPLIALRLTSVSTDQ